MKTPGPGSTSPLPLSLPGWLLGCLALLLTTGCQNQRQDLVESELRCKIQRIEVLEQEKSHLKSTLGQLEAELVAQQRLAAKSPHPTGATVIVKRITLGRLTGGYRSEPNITHDDAVQVLLEPRDPDGAAVKAPGSVHIDVYEVTPEGLKSPLSAWDLSPGELRRTWDNPLLGGPSYRIELPWKVWPTLERLKVVVRFTALDGTAFEAEKEVQIRLPDRRMQHLPPPAVICPPGEQLPPLPTLPQPTPMDKGPLLLPANPQQPAPAPAPAPGPLVPSASWRPVGNKPEIQQTTGPAPAFEPPAPPQPPAQENTRPRLRLLAPVGRGDATVNRQGS